MVNIAEIPTYVLEQLGAATYNAVLAHMMAAKNSEAERKNEQEETA